VAYVGDTNSQTPAKGCELLAVTNDMGTLCYMTGMASRIVFWWTARKSSIGLQRMEEGFMVALWRGNARMDLHQVAKWRQTKLLLLLLLLLLGQRRLLLPRHVALQQAAWWRQGVESGDVSARQLVFWGRRKTEGKWFSHVHFLSCVMLKLINLYRNSVHTSAAMVLFAVVCYSATLKLLILVSGRNENQKDCRTQRPELCNPELVSVQYIHNASMSIGQEYETQHTTISEDQSI
jgi:hypothetical protein